MQYLAEASQKFTCPVVAKVDPAFTDAVRITTLPTETVVTALPPEVTARDVVVACLVCAAVFDAPHAITARTTDKATDLLRVHGIFKIKGEKTTEIAEQKDGEMGFMTNVLRSVSDFRHQPIASSLTNRCSHIPDTWNVQETTESFSN